jgi:glycosyltransferase involved in cell wall biosynthesis
MYTRSKTPYLLFLPRWYPSAEFPQHGIFNQKHIECLPIQHKVVLSLHPGNGFSIKSSSENNSTVYRATYAHAENATIKNLLHYAYAFFRALGIIRQEQGLPVLLHSLVGSRNLVLASLVSTFWKRPLIHSEHRSAFFEESQHPLKGFRLQLALWALGKASVLSVPSSFLAKRLMLLSPNLKPIIIPNVVRSLSVKKHAPNTPQLKLVMVCDFHDAVKNIRGFLDLFQAFPNEWTLAIYGSGQDDALVREHAQFLGLSEPRLCFKGATDNERVLEILPDYDVLCLNSRIETFSIVAAEAIGSGLAVVSTPCGGPESFLGFPHTKVVKSKRPEDWVNAIREVVTAWNPETVRSASDLIQETFGPDQAGKEWMKVYREMAVRKGRELRIV